MLILFVLVRYAKSGPLKDMYGQADEAADLKQCQVQCSSQCRTLAAKFKPLVESAENCGAATSIVNRCNYHFSGANASTCAGNATDVDVIDRCACRTS